MSITPLFILSYKDVAVDCRRDPQIIQIHIKQSKTDPFRKGVKPSLGRTDNAVYPVGAVLAYLAVRDHSLVPYSSQDKTDPSRNSISVQP